MLIMRLIVIVLVSRFLAAEETPAPIPAAFIAQVQALGEGLAAGDGTAFTALWDGNALGERVLAGITIPAPERRGFIAGMAKSLSWGETIVKSIGEDGSYRLLRVQRRDGRVFALFRMITGAGTLNYHDLEFDGDGPAARIIDVYVYTTAEPLSETMRTLAAPALARQEGFDLAKFLGLKAGDDLESFQRFNRLSRQGDHAAVVEAFTRLPASIRGSKAALMLRLRSAQQLDNDQHLAAIQDLVAAFPQNQAVDFLMIDGHLMRKEWDQGLACIDRLDRQVDDPYLDSLRAALLLDAGRLPEARDQAEAAVRGAPDVAHAWWMLVTVTLRQKDHGATADVLTRLQKRFGLAIGDLGDADEYRDFVASQEYLAWRRAQDKAAAPTPP